MNNYRSHAIGMRPVVYPFVIDLCFIV